MEQQSGENKQLSKKYLRFQNFSNLTTLEVNKEIRELLLSGAQQIDVTIALYHYVYQKTTQIFKDVQQPQWI